MSFWLQHLPVLPIVTPLVAGALMLLLADTSRHARGAISLVSTVAQLAAAIALLAAAGGGGWPGGVGVYLVGDWAAPFGIVLVVDRLAAVMLTLTSVLGLATLIYALARWDRAGVHFHSLFQFLLMGLNGAFLTGDLFNLFVFFEVLLAASYGLLLRLGRGARQRRHAVHRREPGGVLPAADQHRADLRRDRHAEHGRSGAARRRAGRRRPHAVRGRRGGAGRGLPGQGGRLAAELLAGQGLRLGRRAHRRHVLHHDQGRHHALLRIGSAAAHRRAGRLQPGLDVRRRPGDAAVRRPGAAGRSSWRRWSAIA